MKVFVFFLLLIAAANALDNGLALTPPMGWMSWQRFRCIIDCERFPKECISEDLIKEQADVMSSEGYLAAGYNYVNIDDCWSEMHRDNDVKIPPSKTRFPSGMKSLSDYLHGKGFKFGLYLDYGSKTCEGYPGTRDHDDTDAKSLADWGVDFIKVDGCNIDRKDMVAGYTKFGKALNASGRSMVYSCSWPAYFEYYRRPTILADYDVLVENCNLWRNYVDIDDSWTSVSVIMDYYIDNQDRLIPFSGPGHWHDPDTLLLGNYGLTYDQSKVQLAVWAMLAAPFLLSADLRTVEPEIKALILNREIIAIDQDPLGIMGRVVNPEMNRVRRVNVWVRPVLPIVNGKHSYAVAYVNRWTYGVPQPYQATLSALTLDNPNGYNVKDLFDSKRSEFIFQQGDTVEEMINPMGVNMYKFTPRQ